MEYPPANVLCGCVKRSHQVNVNMTKTSTKNQNAQNWNAGNYGLDMSLNLVLLIRKTTSSPEAYVLGLARPDKTR